MSQSNSQDTTDITILSKDSSNNMSEEDFVEFGNINHDCPARDYGTYKWSNEKKKWIRQRL